MGAGLIRTYISGKGKPKGCIIVLPGRHGSAVALMSAYQEAELTDTVLVGMEPEQEWYPLPNGVGDQSEAVRGIKKARKALLRHIGLVQRQLGFASRQVALVGFSAGAVMAIQCGLRSREELAGVVAHSGAILQPRKTPAARFIDMPFLLTHNEYDTCFSWHERYLPMKKVLRKRGYYVTTLETNDPLMTHGLSRQDVVNAAIFLSGRLGYQDWRHSSEE